MSQPDLLELLLSEADDALGLQRGDGAMPAGRNGSYGHPETPARNTSHAVVSFSNAYRATGKPAYRDAAERALAYLLEAYDYSPGCIIMRHAARRDLSNGVLGPAFLTEAFHCGWRILGNARARDAAVTLIARHEFDAAKSCWNRVDPEGRSLSPDLTFNHQLYFASTIAMFRGEDSRLDAQLDQFITGWPRTLQIRTDGRVAHEITVKPSLKRRIRNALKGKSALPAVNPAKETDYHLYNCYAFAILARSGLDVPAAVGPRWAAIDRFTRSAKIAATLRPEGWATPMRSGAETRMADYMIFQQSFNGVPVDQPMVAQFLIQSLGPGRRAELLSPDPVTQKARIYRYWRLVDGHQPPAPWLPS